MKYHDIISMSNINFLIIILYNHTLIIKKCVYILTNNLNDLEKINYEKRY